MFGPLYQSSLLSFNQGVTVGNLPAAKFVFPTLPSGTTENTVALECAYVDPGAHCGTDLDPNST